MHFFVLNDYPINNYSKTVTVLFKSESKRFAVLAKSALNGK